jgi:hypothetical protein
MKTTSGKKQFHIKRILWVLFFSTLIFTVLNYYKVSEFFKSKKTNTVFQKASPKYFDFGVLIDSTYCNDFFKFRISISKGHQGDYKIYDYTSISILKRDSVPASPRLASEVTEHDLLLITPQLVKVDVKDYLAKTTSIKELLEYSAKKSKRDLDGPEYHLVIRAYKLSGQSITTYASQFSNIHGPEYGAPQTKMISGMAFWEYEGMETQNTTEGRALARIMGRENKNINSYMIEINDFALSINLFYKTEAQKCELLKMVETISFH